MTVSSEAKRRIIERTMQRIERKSVPRRRPFIALVAAATLLLVVATTWSVTEQKRQATSSYFYVPFTNTWLSQAAWTTGIAAQKETMMGAYWIEATNQLNVYAAPTAAITIAERGETVKTQRKTVSLSLDGEQQSVVVYRATIKKLSDLKVNGQSLPMKKALTEQQLITSRESHLGHFEGQAFNGRAEQALLYQEKVNNKTYYKLTNRRYHYQSIVLYPLRYDKAKRAFVATSQTGSVREASAYRTFSLNQTVNIPPLRKGELRALQQTFGDLRLVAVERPLNGGARVWWEKSVLEPLTELEATLNGVPLKTTYRMSTTERDVNLANGGKLVVKTMNRAVHWRFTAQ